MKNKQKPFKDMVIFKKLNRDCEFISSLYPALSPNETFYGDDMTLSDVMYPHLSEEEKGDLTELLTKLEEMADNVIHRIEKESKKYI